ncbi:MAG: Fe-S cluster assembly protein SufD [Muribaculaceae bacterium]
MSAIKQYTDIFTTYSDAINAHSAPVLNAVRPDALNALENARMPRKGDEDYEATDLHEMFAPDYGVNINRVNLTADPAEAFRCDVPNMSTSPYYFFNDVYHHVGDTLTPHRDGVIVSSLRKAAEDYPDLVARHYARIAPLSNPQVALNTLLAQDGIFVYVPQRVALERTLQLVNIMNVAQPVMAVRRVLVVLEEGAQARMLVCDHTQSRTVQCLSNQVIEVSLGEGATFDFYDLEATADTSRRASSLWAHQAAGSNLLVDGITLANGITRNDYHISVDGEHAETSLLGMAIMGGNQNVDNHTFIGHNVGHCHSNELFKYVLDDHAIGAFSGKILVAGNAPKVEAYQSNRNVCASTTAKMFTKPQLEIYTDDVKCSHGATVGQLDQDALFYMRTRGIPEHEARTLLMQAFMSDVIDGVRIEALKDRLHHLVEKRFAGALADCGECAGKCLRNKK